jgi:TPP-dependent pyruvate/acetoin dehydrogenase alpha subunit
MPGLVVDGNDVFAVYAATHDAVDRARRGGGPTLIEALTFRMGPHSSADDPGRYRGRDTVDEWRRRDPIERMQRFLAAQGRWSADWQAEVEREVGEEVERAVAAAEALPPPTFDEMLDGMFASLPAHLVAQRAEGQEGP